MRRNVIHPELEEQLTATGSDPVQAVLQLREPDRPEHIPTAEEFEKLAQALVQRVEERTGRVPVKLNTLRNVATVIVEGPADFVREFASQPEVISAMPGKTRQEALIRPRRKRSV